MLHLEDLGKNRQIRFDPSFSLLAGVKSSIVFLLVYSFISQVEVLVLDKSGNSSGRRSVPNKNLGQMPRHNRSSSNEFTSQLHDVASCPVDSLRQNLASIIEEHGSSRRSLSESVLADSTNASGSVSLRKQFHNEEETTCKVTRSSDEDNSYTQVRAVKFHLSTI